MMRVDAKLVREGNKVFFVGENEIEHGGKKGGIAGCLADVVGPETAFGEKPAEAGRVARAAAIALFSPS